MRPLQTNLYHYPAGHSPAACLRSILRHFPFARLRGARELTLENDMRDKLAGHRFKLAGPLFGMIRIDGNAEFQTIALEAIDTQQGTRYRRAQRSLLVLAEHSHVDRLGRFRRIEVKYAFRA